MTEKANQLEWIDPPPDGVEKLLHQIEKRTRRRTIVAGMALVAIVAVAVIQQPKHAPPGSGTSLENYLDHTMDQQDPNQTIQSINGATLEIESSSPNSKIYLVAPMPSPGDAQESPEPY